MFWGICRKLRLPISVTIETKLFFFDLISIIYPLLLLFCVQIYWDMHQLFCIPLLKQANFLFRKIRNFLRIFRLFAKSLIVCERFDERQFVQLFSTSILTVSDSQIYAAVNREIFNSYASVRKMSSKIISLVFFEFSTKKL